MEHEPLFRWAKIVAEFLEFAGAYLAAGAVGFRYVAVAGARRSDPQAAGAGGAPYVAATRRAAAIGLVGGLLGLYHVASSLPEMAARRHLAVPALLSTSPPAATALALSLLALVGFILALRGRGPGWALAAVGVIAGILRGALFGQWDRLVKPVHLLSGGLWIGTLFMLVVAGLPAALRSEGGSERRGAIVAYLVRAFSPFALALGGALALCGVILAWTELGRLDALWTTPFGRTLMIKLALVAGVFGLGAWNWRRQKPALGSEAAARSLRATASSELLIALLVVMTTAVLATLPSPSSP